MVAARVGTVLHANVCRDTHGWQAVHRVMRNVRARRSLQGGAMLRVLTGRGTCSGWVYAVGTVSASRAAWHGGDDGR